MVDILNVVFCIFLCIIAYIDIKYFRIPNILLIALLVVFIPYVFSLGLSLESILERIVFAAMALGIGWFFYKIYWIGAGDAKYAAVLALWISQENLISFLLFMAFASLALSSVALFVKKNGKKQLAFSKRKIPFGVVLSLAALGVISQQYL